MAEDEGAGSSSGTLRRNSPRLFAHGLLLLAVALFVASHLDPSPGTATMLLQRVSEAALIGGIADWFAIVALFRHPLGLPIPHTAVVPRNKDRIGVGLGQFAERHLLDPETVARKLRAADLPLQAANWLSRPENAALLADRAAQALSFFVAALPDDELRTFVRRTTLRQLSNLDLVPIVAAAVEALRDSGRHQDLYDTLISGAHRYLMANRGRLRGEVETRSAWWVPAIVDRGLATVMIEQGASLLNELLAADSGMRREFDGWTARLIDDIRHAPEYREQIESFKRELMAGPAVDASLDHLADDVRRLLNEDIAGRRSAIRLAIENALVSFAQRLAEDETARRRIERRLVWIVRSLVLPWRRDIGRFIAEVVRGWEARTVSERLEEAVGRDLQYIRINGTIVGGIVGGLIFLIGKTLF